MIYAKGIDHGFYNTKDSDYNMFRSAFSRTDSMLSDKSKIIINGTTYYFGYGNTTGDNDKSSSLVNMVSTMAILAMTGDYEYCLVVGLPIIQYKSMKDKLRDSIMQYNGYSIRYQNKEFKAKIKDVTVFAQGVGALFNIGLEDGEYISLDIGSYTINVVLVEIINGIPHIKKYDTWFIGILTLYNKVIKAVNDAEGVTLDTEDAPRILTKGLLVKGEKRDDGYVKGILEDYLDDVLGRFKQNYPNYSIIPIMLSGGGAIMFSKFFTNRFSNSMMLPNSQFANAIGYGNFAKQKYGYLLEGRCVNV